MIAELKQKFAAATGVPGTVFFAPGRINLIGEHTDYSDGFVLPASIGLGTWVAMAPRNDRQVRVHSEAQDETAAFSLDALQRCDVFHWSRYVEGVAWALQRHGYRVQGADLWIASSVPLGSGLSSSASLEVAVALALLGMTESNIPPMQLAQICQSAENDFVGARCGLMDQFAATHGLRDHALLLNCSTLEWRPVALPVNYRWVVANTMVRHSLASGEYNVRRAEVETLQDTLHRELPHCAQLHQLHGEDYERFAAGLPAHLRRRLRHIVGENTRLLEFVAHLQYGDMAAAGRLLNTSHQSLRDDFEVSCGELDTMVTLAGRLPGALGARMLGGGFGGCVLALVEAGQVSAFVGDLQEAYARSTGIDAWIHVCDIEQGARRIA